MKAWTYILFLFMITYCSGSSSNSQNLTWYNNATISQITEDPDHPKEFLRISIGISPQIFYVSKKNDSYVSILEKLNQSLQKGKKFNIGIENNTNIIKKVNDIT